MTCRAGLRSTIPVLAASAVVLVALGGLLHSQDGRAATETRQNPNINRPITNETFVRRQMLERHEPPTVQPTRGATWSR